MSRKRKANVIPDEGGSSSESSSPQLVDNPLHGMNRTPANITTSISDFTAHGARTGSSQIGQNTTNPFQFIAPLMQAQPNQYTVAQMNSILHPLLALLGTNNLADGGIAPSHLYGHDSRRYDSSRSNNHNAPTMEETTLHTQLQMLNNAHRSSQVLLSHQGTYPQVLVRIPAAVGSPNPANLPSTLQLLGMLQNPEQSANLVHPPISSVAFAHSLQNNIQNTSQTHAGSRPGEQELGGPVDETLTLYLSCDDHMLSKYQCLIRKQIELFAAGNEDTCTIGQGRNRRVQDGQVGIRCKHCRNIPKMARTKGAVYFPFKTDNVYQACQNMAAVHFFDKCPNIPKETKVELQRLAAEPKSTTGGGKRYWSEAIRAAGIVEDTEGRLGFGKKDEK